MKNLIKKGWYVVLAACLFAGSAQAQFTSSDLETGLFYSALAKDASNNIYVIQVEPGTSGAQGEVVKYTNGAGAGTVIYSGFHEGDNTGPGGDMPWGLAVTSNGDVYMTTDFFSLGGAIIKLTFNSGTNTYTPSTFQQGSYYAALAVDKNDNLYTTQYDPTGNGGSGSYAVYRYTLGGVGTRLYDNLRQLSGYSYPTGLAVDANLNVYVTDAYNEDGTVNDGGHVYELTAASSYATPVTVSSGNYASSLAVDAAGNLYSTENTGTNDAGYKLLKYTNGTGTPTVLYSPLHTDGIYYPWGIAVVSSTDIFANDADDISGDGLGAADGAVLQLIGAPTTQANNVTFSNTTGTGTTASWTNGNGSAVAVFIAQVSTGSPVPVNATTYTANTAFGSGTQVGASGWYCVYNGTGTSVGITGLTTGDTYRVMAVAYNGSGTDANYLTTVATNNPNNVTATSGVSVNSISLVTSSPTNASTVQYTVTFGASVTGLTAGNFSLTTTGSVSGAGISSVSGSGAIFTVTVNTGTGDGTLGLNLANATNLAPTISTSLPFAGSVYTIQKSPPTLTSLLYTPFSGYVALGGAVTLTFGTNVPIQTPTVTIAGHSITATNTGGNNYSATYNMTASDVEGRVPFTLTVTDLAGNQASFTDVAAGDLIIYDKTPPTINIGNPSVSSVTTGGGPVTYTVTYADANFNSSTLSPADITLVTTGTATGSIGVTGSGTSYTVTVSGISGAGSIGISIQAGTATDLAGNAAPASGPSATFAVNLISQHITFNALPAKTYGDADFAPGATSDDNGIPITYSSDNSAVATIVAGNIHIVGAGIANITASQTGDATHAPASNVIQPLTVNQAPLTITADNQSSTYGQAIPALTITYSGFVNGDTQASLTTAATASTTATAASPTGSYTITPSGAVDNNYVITYVNGTLKIGQAALTITADNQTSTYGSAIPALTITYSGFVNGDTQASLTTAATASTAATAASPAGSYAITPSGAVDNNYAITYVNGTLKIGQAALTITADNQTSTYGSAIPALTITYSGFVNGDTQASLTTAATASTTATAASPAGSYVITPSGAVDNNYAITYVNGTLKIGQAALTVTADNQSSTYGSAIPALTITYSGFVNGNTQASLTTAATASTTATAASPAGSYAITPSGAVDNNYVITYVNGTLKIGQAALTITADNQTSTYGSAIPALTITYSGFVNGDTQASLTTAATASTTATATSPAGSYTITPSGAVDNNYAITYVNGTLKIGQAALTITADNQTSTYGSAIPALTITYSGFVNGDTQASLTTAATASTTATAASPVGSYTITPSGAVDNNYTITYVNGTLKIGQATLTVTANNQTSTYGSALPALTLTYSGFVNGDTQASLTTAATASTTATAASPAGSYAITPSGAVDNNYTITYVNGTLNIGQAALTVTANNQTSIYGSALPALTISYSGFVNGDTQASLTTAATASTTATAVSPAGSYAITPSGAVDNNYAITYVNGTLKIGQAALTITADNQTSTYGSAIPALTITYSGFVNGDTQASLTTAATASTTATAASPVGSYIITPSGAVDNNYAITYVNGTLKIGQAALTVTADNQSSTYGSAIPALTITYSGFVNGDTQASLTTAATASTTATAASPAGSYAITPSGAVDNNYAITYVNGTLKIGQATLTVTANNQTSTYGSALPALTITYSGFVNGDTQASLTTAATASTSATAASPAGSYTITPSGAVDNNYAITYVNGTLNIGQATLTVTANNQTSTYGSALPALSISYSGFVNGDTQASLTTAATASTTATAASPVGSYTISPSGAVDNNYAITYVNGTLNIGQATLTVAANNQTSTYGSALPALTISYTGFVNGDTQASLTTAATAATTATASSPVGSYNITPGGAVDNNYAITYVNGTLSIGQATLTVTANDQTSTYGQAMPALTVSYSGFVNGDTQASLTTSATATTAATTTSTVGTYAITPAGAVDGNYTFNYVDGTLTINQATRTLTFNALSTKKYGDADFSPGATASDNETINYESSNTAVATIIGGLIHITGVGSTMITASLTANSNYTTNPTATETLVVDKGDQTINLVTIPNLLKGSRFDLSVITASSGLPLTFTTADATVASVQGQTLSAIDIGTTTLTISQPGNEDYNAATTQVETINVNDAAGDDILVHQAVSPNGDGINDFLYIEGIDRYKENTVSLINRNGVLIFQASRYDNKNNVFVGRSNITGALQEPGTYFYRVDIFVNGQRKSKVGFFVLKYN